MRNYGYLLLAISNVFAACGGQPKKPAASRAVLAKSDASKIELIVPLFLPSDLKNELAEIEAQMTGYHITLTPTAPSDVCVTIDKSGSLDAASVDFRLPVPRKCAYGVTLAYGALNPAAAAPAPGVAPPAPGSPPAGPMPSAPAPGPSPMTGGQATYLTQVKPILNASCAVAGCHVAGTSYVGLDTYAKAKEAGGKTIDRVQGIGGARMPPGSALSASDIAILKAWQAAGYPEGAMKLVQDPVSTPPASGLSKVFYQTKTPLDIKESDYEGYRTLTLHFRLSITDDGHTLGLNTEEIQGKTYKRGSGVASAAAASPTPESAPPATPSTQK